MQDEKILELINKKKIDNINEYSPLSLAFIGDAVHTLFVRSHIVSCENFNVNKYHSLSSAHCKASAQAKFLDEIKANLSANEQDIIRRARNAKSHHTAKNADIETYKKATSFEALIGYLFLTNQNDRLLEILKKEEY